MFRTLDKDYGDRLSLKAKSKILKIKLLTHDNSNNYQTCEKNYRTYDCAYQTKMAT
jgi:hypothetical protein